MTWRVLSCLALMGAIACGGRSQSEPSFDAQGVQPECVNPSDCSGGNICIEGECAAPTCDDDVLSAGESDIDCGGTECPACTEGQSCTGPGDCASSFCDGGVCRDCEVVEDCSPVPGTLCVAGVCRGDAPLGQACTEPTQCESGFCVDSVCCDTRCSGVCESCSAADTGANAGTCGGIMNGMDPADECEMDSPVSCGQSGSCNGAGACALYTASTTCAPDMCIGTTYTFESRCNGAGACEPGPSFECETGCSSGFCADL